MILKILGLLLVILGFFILKFFPDISRYQREGMTLSGILIGAMFFLVGILLIIFG
jgi:hypothetical protein